MGIYAFNQYDVSYMFLILGKQDILFSFPDHENYIEISRLTFVDLLLVCVMR
jgi:hypothetical protein